MRSACMALPVILPLNDHAVSAHALLITALASLVSYIPLPDEFAYKYKLPCDKKVRPTCASLALILLMIDPVLNISPSAVILKTVLNLDVKSLEAAVIALLVLKINAPVTPSIVIDDALPAACHDFHVDDVES